MPKLSKRLEDALDAVGARLKRTKKHRVYELPNGRTFVVGSTPSDNRAEQNALSDLRAISGVDTQPERRKASAEVRAERRRRPGRAGEPPWRTGTSALASAMRESGVAEKSMRVQIDELRASVDELRSIVDAQAEVIREREARIVALESLWVVRAWRYVRGTFKGE
jgi:hypothetical protein